MTSARRYGNEPNVWSLELHRRQLITAPSVALAHTLLSLSIARPTTDISHSLLHFMKWLTMSTNVSMQRLPLLLWVGLTACSSLDSSSCRSDEGAAAVKQAMPIDAAVSMSLSRPKGGAAFIVRVPHSIFTSSLERNFQQSYPFECTILGTHSKGIALCQGSVKCELEECATGIVVVCKLSGEVTSKSHGLNGPAKISSRATTTFVARKKIHVDGQGLKLFPCCVETSTRLDVTGIDSELPGLRGRIVRNVAARKAQQTQQEAEAQIAALVRKDLQQQVDDEFNTQSHGLSSGTALFLSLAAKWFDIDKKVSVRSSGQHVEIVWAADGADAASLSSTRHTSDKAIELWIRTPSFAFSRVLAPTPKSKPHLGWISTYLNTASLWSPERQGTVETLNQSTKHNDWLVFNLSD